MSEPTIVDLLREDLNDRKADEGVYIPIPGYERTGLAAHYHLPDSGKELTNIAEKVERQVKGTFDRGLLTAIDVMVYLCDGLYIRHPDSGEPVMLDPDLTGEPVRFNKSLAAILGWEDDMTARNIVRRLFRDNEMAIISHSEKLQRWLQDTNADIEGIYWGNSQSEVPR